MTNNIHIRVFTDGASSGNPGSGGWGAVVQFPGGNIQEIGAGALDVTNNQMELDAAIGALKLSIESAVDWKEIHIFTDSSYVIQGIEKWVNSWKRNGWKTKQGEDVKNKNRWEELDSLAQKASLQGRVRWIHVPGHAGVGGNERADQIAVSFSKNGSVHLYEGSGKNYSIDLTWDPKAITKKPVNRKKGKAIGYLSKVDGVTVRHSKWADCENRVRGRSSPKFKKILSAEDEASILKDWGVDPKDVQ